LVQAGDSQLKDRTVRLFVSSTFRDFNLERELLVKQVFPEVEHYCASKQIAFSYVDLRWGYAYLFTAVPLSNVLCLLDRITEEMSGNGQVITACLEQVDNCYPFFLGMLGERYGWHDQREVTGQADPLLNLTFNNAIASGHHWLNNFRSRSVTELEIIYGALRYIPTSHFGNNGHEDYGCALYFLNLCCL